VIRGKEGIVKAKRNQTAVLRARLQLAFRLIKQAIVAKLVQSFLSFHILGRLSMVKEIARPCRISLIV
jgi:hypothetical protein